MGGLAHGGRRWQLGRFAVVEDIQSGYLMARLEVRSRLWRERGTLMLGNLVDWATVLLQRTGRAAHRLRRKGRMGRTGSAR